jgi:hypothetical protein
VEPDGGKSAHFAFGGGGAMSGATAVPASTPTTTPPTPTPAVFRNPLRDFFSDKFLPHLIIDFMRIYRYPIYCLNLGDYV